MLLPPQQKTEAPFSNLTSPSTSLLSRFSYINRLVYNYYNLIAEKKTRLTYLDCIVFLDIRVWEADSSSVVSHDVRNFVLAEMFAFDLAKLEGSLFGVNAVGLEATLDIVENTEVLACLWK